MRHLIIIAHPRVRSFNHSILGVYAAAVAERGHRVKRRDLYAIGFKPALSARDVARRKQPTRTNSNQIEPPTAVVLMTV